MSKNVEDDGKDGNINQGEENVAGTWNLSIGEVLWPVVLQSSGDIVENLSHGGCWESLSILFAP